MLREHESPCSHCQNTRIGISSRATQPSKSSLRSIYSWGVVDIYFLQIFEPSLFLPLLSDTLQGHPSHNGPRNLGNTILTRRQMTERRRLRPFTFYQRNK